MISQKYFFEIDTFCQVWIAKCRQASTIEKITFGGCYGDSKSINFLPEKIMTHHMNNTRRIKGGIVKAEEINNYGKSMLDLMAAAPQELMARVFRANADMIAGNLTPSELERFMQLKSAKVQTLQEKDLSALKSRGLESPNLVAQQIEWSASFAAFSEIKSETTSLAVFQRIVETTYPPMFSSMLPDPDVLASCDDPFDAFSNWFLAYMKANQQAGLFVFDLVDKNNKKFHFTCNWCAWREIHKCLGAPKACSG